MSQNENANVVVEEVNVEADATLTLETKLADALAEIFQIKEMRKEQKDREEVLMDVVRELYERLGGQERIAELHNGIFAKVQKRVTVKDKLDKEELSQRIKIDVDELKTPWDFSKLTEKGVLTPGMIAEHTKPDTKERITVTKLKKKPKEKKKKF